MSRLALPRYLAEIIYYIFKSVNLTCLIHFYIIQWEIKICYNKNELKANSFEGDWLFTHEKGEVAYGKKFFKGLYSC